MAPSCTLSSTSLDYLSFRGCCPRNLSGARQLGPHVRSVLMPAGCCTGKHRTDRSIACKSRLQFFTHKISLHLLEWSLGMDAMSRLSTKAPCTYASWYTMLQFFWPVGEENALYQMALRHCRSPNRPARYVHFP